MKSTRSSIECVLFRNSLKLLFIIVVAFSANIGSVLSADKTITPPQKVFLGPPPNAQDANLARSLDKYIDGLKETFNEENVVFVSKGTSDFRLDEFEVFSSAGRNMPLLKARYYEPSRSSGSDESGVCDKCTGINMPVDRVAAVLVRDLINNTLLNYKVGLFPPITINSCKKYVQGKSLIFGIDANWEVREVEKNVTYQLYFEDGPFIFPVNVYFELIKNPSPSNYDNRKRWRIQFKLLLQRTDEVEDFVKNCSDPIRGRKYSFNLRLGIPNALTMSGPERGLALPVLVK